MLIRRKLDIDAGCVKVRFWLGLCRCPITAAVRDDGSDAFGAQVVMGFVKEDKMKGGGAIQKRREEGWSCEWR